MKKIIFLFALLLMVVGLHAQTLPESVPDAIANIDVLMGSLLGIGLLSVFVTGLIIGFFGELPGAVKQILSWAVPVVLAVVVGNLLNIGFLAEEPIAIGVLYGLGAGLVSNGIFDIGFVGTLITWIQSKLK